MKRYIKVNVVFLLSMTFLIVACGGAPTVGTKLARIPTTVEDDRYYAQLNVLLVTSELEKGLYPQLEARWPNPYFDFSAHSSNVEKKLITDSIEFFERELSKVFNTVYICKSLSDTRRKNNFVIFTPKIERASCFVSITDDYDSADVKISISYRLRIFDSEGSPIDVITASAYASDTKSTFFRNPFGLFKALLPVALHDAVDDVISRIVRSTQLRTYAQNIFKQQTLPANLIAKVKYSDKTSLIPNNSIDAGEESSITVTLTNNGKGTAFDVKLTTASKYTNINFPKTVLVGDIQPGGSKELTAPIKAKLSLATGTARFLIKAHEKRGYDARPVELQIPTAKLRSPRLLFSSCNLNDSSGLATGDGDTIPENNETIELDPYVKNEGVGDALKVTVKLTDVTPGIKIVKGTDELTSIGPSTIGKATLAFKIPRTFAQPEIKYTIVATDIRGMKTEKTYSTPFHPKTPILYCTYQVVDARNREIPGLENGKSYSLKIIPKNTGENIAQGVKVQVTPESEKVIIGNYHGNVGTLQPDSVGPVLAVPITLNRSFVDPALSLSVAMTQEDFPGFSKKITLPVMVKRPRLQYQVVLLNGISESIVSQNSWPRFRVSLSNNGNLDATEVKIQFHVLNKDIPFEKEETIGTIKAGESQYKDFTYFIRGDAPVGEMPVKLSVTQTDFDELSTIIAYRLTEQTALVQKVRATGSGPGVYGSPTYLGPAELYINSPIKDTKTYKETIDLHGSIMTFGPGNAIQKLSISLNNRPLTIIPVTEGIRFKPNQITKRTVEGNKTIFDGLIALKPGVNEIKIKCTDRNNQKSEQTIKITKLAKLGNIYAVVIGISNFANVDYNLEYASSDARKFYEFLKSETGGQLPENRIRLLADSTATRASVIGTLTNFLGRSTKQDTIEIYLATHGLIDFDGTLYYLCYDTDIENLRGTGFSDNELTDILKNIRAGKIIIYLDACHAGSSGLSERYAKRGIRLYEVNERINSLAAALSKTSATGVVTFSASSSTGYSIEGPKWDGGIFTHCLVKGLEGEANENEDEWVSVNELDSYLVRNVMALTEGKQRPKVNGTLMGDTPLSKVK